MLKLTCQILFLEFPLILAAIAQGFCIKYDWLHALKKPLDFGTSFRGKRIFGDNKTWRGLVINVLFCSAGAIIEVWLQKKNVVPPWFLLADYTKHGYQIGVLLGLGMTLGELPNSFLKRRLEIPPGGKKGGFLGVLFFLFDQVDLIIGIWILLFFLIRPSIVVILWSFVLTAFLHVVISSVGYLLRMRKTIV